MLDRDQTVKIKWNNKLAEHYMSKGYPKLPPFTEFEVRLEDLPLSSNQKVNIVCDGCGSSKKRNYNSVKNNELHFCSNECRKLLNKHTKEELIGEFYRYFKEKGRYPNQPDMQVQHGYPSYYYYIKLWGSWDNFIKEMDVKAEGHGNWLKEDIQTLIDFYEDNPKEIIMDKLINKITWNNVCLKARELGLKRKYKVPSTLAYSKEFLVNEFWRYFKENGVYPQLKDMNNTEGFPGASGYMRIWKSWDALLKDIGVVDKNNNDGWYICDENILREKYSDGKQQDIIDSLLVKRKWGSIVVKANQLGLSRDKSKIRQKYSKEELIDKLKELADSLGRTPKDHDIRKLDDFPCAKVFQKYFGSWNKALESAGLKINNITEYTKEEIMEEATDFFNKHERSPYYNELKFKRGIISHFWDTWEDFLTECQLPIKEKRKAFNNKKEGIEYLQKLAKEINDVPTATYLAEIGIFRDWFARKFGSYNKALYEAGLVSIEYTYSKDELIMASIEILKGIFREKGGAPTALEYDTKIKNTGFLNRKALEFNLKMKFSDICILFLGTANQYSKPKDILMEELVDLKNKLGRVPYIKELTENGLSNFKQYQNAFNKTYAELCEDLGWELPYTRPKYKSNEELLKDYMDLYENLNRIPFPEDIDSDDKMCNSSTYLSRFGSLKDIWELLNIEYKEELLNHSLGIGITCFDKNGDICRSYNEMIITNYLIDNNVKFIKEYPYKKVIKHHKSRKRFDWYLLESGICIEYFGLYNEKYLNNDSWLGEYSRKVKEKIALCKNSNIPLIEIYPHDLENKQEGLINKFNNYQINLLVV